MGRSSLLAIATVHEALSDAQLPIPLPEALQEVLEDLRRGRLTIRSMKNSRFPRGLAAIGQLSAVRASFLNARAAAQEG